MNGVIIRPPTEAAKRSEMISHEVPLQDDGRSGHMSMHDQIYA
jgi:hypothetical protein